MPQFYRHRSVVTYRFARQARFWGLSGSIAARRAAPCAWAAALIVLLAWFNTTGIVRADGPKPVPATRTEMKTALERLKLRQPRLPLTVDSSAGERARVVHNGLARRLYLPAEWYSADFRSSPDMTLDNTFKVQIFWIVSRSNNCHYCLGHQEIKLSMMGMEEDAIARLDVDWSEFPESSQLAFALAQKMTLTPHEVTDEDIEHLKPHFSSREIIELVYTIAFYNSVNRWTDGLGLPQDQAFRQRPLVLDTPTSPAFAARTTIVAPLRDLRRGDLESLDEVQSIWDACREREPVVPLVSQQEAKERLGSYWPDAELPNWVRALAAFEFPDGGHVAAVRAVCHGGNLAPKLKAHLMWTTARHNRAWYTLDLARRHYEQLGVSLQQAFVLGPDAEQLSEAERAAVRLAEKMTVTPQRIEDADIQAVRAHFPDNQVAEIVYVVCTANMLDRLTETLRLPLDGSK